MKKKNKPFFGLFAKLSVSYIIIGLIPIFLISAFFLKRLTDNVEKIMLSDAEMVLQSTTSTLDTVINEWKEDTENIYDITDIQEENIVSIVLNPSITQKEKSRKICDLMGGFNTLSGIRSVRYLDAQGNLSYICQSVGKLVNQQEMNQWKAKEMRNRSKGNAMMLEGLHLDSYFTNSNDEVVTVKRNVFDVSNLDSVERFLGTFYFDISADTIKEQFQGIHLGEHSTFFIVDQLGNTIYQEENQELSNKCRKEIRIQKKDAAMLTDEENYYLYCKNKDSGWTCILRVYRGDILANVYDTRNYILSIVLMGSIVLFMMYLGFSKKLSYPIQNLKKGMEQIQEGNLDTRVEVKGKDEVGVLAEGLNQMASQLSMYIDRVYGAEIKQKEAELNALKTQIKPHYLYNTLDIIRMTAMKHEDRETAEMLESLARQLRYLMGEEKEMVSLEQELDNIRDYFQMMRIRYEGRISLNITVPESLREIAVLKLLVQPAVENAVKHGLKEKDGQGSVWISANRKAEKVEVTVMDDGVGMDTEQLEAIRKRISAGTKELHNPEKGGVGLVNVNERIQNRYGCQYGVQIESTKGAGTIVIICIPYLSEGEKDV